MTYWIYILSSRRHGTLYVSVTNSLETRIAQHRAKESPGFTKTYGVDRLVYYLGFGEVRDAIRFEKRLKRWRRDWKIRLIEEESALGRPLSPELRTPRGEAVFMGPGQPLRAFRDDTKVGG